jgi:hypothetical protein
VTIATARRAAGTIALFVGAAMALGSGVVAKEPYAPYLTDARLESIANLLKGDRTRLNLEQEEMRYQDAVRGQTLADLAKVYAPENADRVQVAYVSFTPEASSTPGDDRGYGLHIVKRLDLPLSGSSGGETKTIYVNEQWREDKPSRGLCLPDEIRIQTQVTAGRRRVRGSDKLYVFDAVRIGWGPFNRDPQLARHTIYKRVNGKNEFRSTRSAVSAPFSCTTCHGPDNHFADAFLASGEARNYEAIVQDRYFRLAPSEMRGYKEYIAYLERSGAEPVFIQHVKATLADRKSASAVPGLFELLTSISDNDGIVWLSEDSQLQELYIEVAKGYQGVYQDAGGRWRTDALEDVLEGKYVWWEPLPVIP